MKIVQIASLLAALALTGQAYAQEPVLGVEPEPAFTEHRLTLQISDAGEAKQATTLNVAFNILKVYGPDKVAIEVVAFGPGIDLMREGNPNAERIHSLVAQGVHFEACNNTIETLERKTGKPFPLNPQARRVISGVAQIMTLAEHGYTTIRP